MKYVPALSSRPFASLVPAALALAASACSSQSPSRPPAPTLVWVAVTPPSPTLAKGTTLALQATGVYSDASHGDLTASAEWSTSDATIATATQGQVVGVAAGTATLTATVGSVAGSVDVRVTTAALMTVAVTPTNATLARGTAAPLTAIGTFADSSTQDLTAAAAWSSSDDAVATVSNAVGTAGRANGAAPGTATITASFDGISGSTTITVTDAILELIAVTPVAPTIPKGTTQLFAATGTFSDGSHQDLTTSATWLSSAPDVATVASAPGAAGQATAQAVGVTTLVALQSGVSGATVLTVSPAVLIALELDPTASSLPSGLSRQFVATGVYSDSSRLDLTTTVTWSSLDDGVATVSNAAGSEGLAHAATPGLTTITATSGTVHVTTSFTVTAAELVAIAVTPAEASLAEGTTRRFTAIGTYTDESTLDLTTSVTWGSLDEAIVTVSNAPASEGLVTAVAEGTGTITVGQGLVQGTTGVTVTTAVLSTIEVTPAGLSLAKGRGQQYIATGVYSDGSRQPQTDTVTWSSSDDGIATVSNAPGSTGMAHAVAEGTVDVTATIGTVSGTTELTVAPAALDRLTVAPKSPLVPKTTSEQFTVVGTYSDLTETELTAAVAWSSSNEAIATISNDAGSEGLAAGLTAGVTTITATLDGVSDTSTMTVTQAPLVSIAVTPLTPSVAKGRTQQFTATGTFADSSTLSLTTSVTWSVGDGAIASVTAGGLATALGVGATSVTATKDSIPGATTINVGPAVVVGFAVSPTSFTTGLGGQLQLTGQNVMSDGSRVDLSSGVGWNTSAAGVATVSSSGLVTGVAYGAVTITATRGADTAVATGSVSGCVQCSAGVCTMVALGADPLEVCGLYTCNGYGACLGTCTWPVGCGNCARCNASSRCYSTVTCALTGYEYYRCNSNQKCYTSCTNEGNNCSSACTNFPGSNNGGWCWDGACQPPLETGGACLGSCQCRRGVCFFWACN